LFESDFLTSTPSSREAYAQLIAKAAQFVSEFLPNRPYSGTRANTLADAIRDSDFLPAQSCSLEKISDVLRRTMENSVIVGHPHTSAHLHCPPLLAALAAEVVITTLNQSMDSFDQAPMASIIEQKMVQWLCAQAGLPATSEGTFTTGGSQSNYMGLLLARDAFLRKEWHWSAQKSGLPPEARRLRVLCSEAAHFTVEKSASQLGLGTDAVMRVPVDKFFRIDVDAFQEILSRLKGQGLLPMAIVATAGTTDFGSIDPLPEIADLARNHGAWLHIDAAYGGALLFSDQHRDKLAGIDAADSVSIDFHKLFWQPIPCSVFLLREASNFDSIKLHAEYLNPEFHEDQGVPNLVTTSLLTSRRFDALKLWISFQALGRDKLAAMIDRAIVLANHTTSVIRRTPELGLLCDPQLSTVVFRYLPPSGIDADHVNLAIRQRLFDQGQAVIGHTRVHNRQCLKFTCMNPVTTEAQMEELIDLILTQGRELARNPTFKS